MARRENASGRSCSRWLGTTRLRCALAPLAVALVIIVALYACSPNFRFESGPAAGPYGGDFLQEWLGGYIVRAGDHARFYDVGYAQQLQHDPRLVGFEWNREAYLPIVYPPFYYLLVSPLSYWPLWIAVWIWAVLMTACLVGTVCMLVWSLRSDTGFLGETGSKLLSRCRNGAVSARQACRAGAGMTWLWLLPAALLFTPTLLSLASSQKGTLCLLLLSATFVLLDRQRPLAAGIVFGLLAFKPQLTLVIAVAMLVKRQWRFVTGGMLAGLVQAALCAAVGVDVCWQYVQFARTASEYINTTGYDPTRSHCLDGFFVLLAGGSATGLTRTATMIASAAVIALLAWQLRGPLQPGSPRFARQFSGLLVATVLLSPHLFAYDLMLLLLPMFLLGLQVAAGQLRPVRPWACALVLLYAAPALAGVVVAATGVQITVVVALVVLGMTACYGDAASVSTGSRNPSSASCLRVTASPNSA